MTRQRKLILDIVNNSHTHPTAEQIFFIAKSVMPKIVMATVYNNINALVSEKLIRRVSIHGEPDRYDSVHKIHDHIKCDRCGTVNDVFIGDMLKELSLKTGLALTSVELNMHYICDSCRSNEIIQ